MSSSSLQHHFLSLPLSSLPLPSALASPLTISIFAHARPSHVEAFLDPPPLKTGLTPSSPVGTHSSTPQSVLSGHVDLLLPGGVSASSRIPTSGVGG